MICVRAFFLVFTQKIPDCLLKDPGLPLCGRDDVDLVDHQRIADQQGSHSGNDHLLAFHHFVNDHDRYAESTDPRLSIRHLCEILAAYERSREKEQNRDRQDRDLRQVRASCLHDRVHGRA